MITDWNKDEAAATDDVAELNTSAEAETLPEDQLDITMGDMETDLPPVEAATPTETADEVEIPWGEVDLSAGETEGASDQDDGEHAAAAIAPVVEAAPAPQAEIAPPKAPVKHAWYVVHCYSGYENKVKKGIEQRINSMGMQDYIFRVIVPIEKEVEIKEGQWRNIERRVFPGYILVEMMELKEGDPDSDQVWYVVRNTPGVTGFINTGDNKPVPLREDEVAKILKRMESEEPKVHVTFRVGQTVHIIDGPFADFRGTVDNVDMIKGKVRVLVSFFGRETPVELDLLQVEKV